jgi:hypothetical protein
VHLAVNQNLTADVVLLPTKTNPTGDLGGRSNPINQATPEGGGQYKLLVTNIVSYFTFLLFWITPESDRLVLWKRSFSKTIRRHHRNYSTDVNG